MVAVIQQQSVLIILKGVPNAMNVSTNICTNGILMLSNLSRDTSRRWSLAQICLYFVNLSTGI